VATLMIGYHERMSKQLLASIAILVFGCTSVSYAKYKIKNLPIKPASEYASSQDFQSIVIGIYPCETLARTQELFDTKKLREKGILPVLLVIENNNTFPIRLRESDIYLVDKSGTQKPVMPFIDVLLRINLKKPLSNFSSKKELTAKKVVDEEMYADFEHKSFGEKLIAPVSSDAGVLFFELYEGESLEGSRLYMPEVVNFSTREALVFFEIDLLPQ
jgi:hypothetical protein